MSKITPKFHLSVFSQVSSRAAILASITWVVVLFLSIPAHAQLCATPGCLDVTFGTNGKVVTQIHTSELTMAQDMAVQSDGKIVAFVGVSGQGWKLFRLSSDGSLDPTFGSGGIVSFDWVFTSSNGSRYLGRVDGLAIQNVGGQERIVIAGYHFLQSGRSTIMGLRMNRYLPDGTLDGSFGTGGTVAFAGDASDVAIQPSDQKIVTIGSISGLVRFNVNGGLDTTFGTGGKSSVGPGQFTRGIAFDPAGGVLISGTQTFGKGKSATNQMTVRRFRSNGTLDTSFGTSGTASASFGYASSGIHVAVDVLSNIVVTGFARAINATGTSNFAVARFTPTGQPDQSFAGTGRAVFDFGGYDDFPTNVLLQASGKIILAGRASPTANSRDFGAVRFNFDGSVDTTFGTGGKMVTDVFGSDTSRGSAMQFDPLCSCEKLVMSGGDTPYTTFARFTTLPY